MGLIETRHQQYSPQSKSPAKNKKISSLKRGFSSPSTTSTIKNVVFRDYPSGGHTIEITHKKVNENEVAKDDANESEFIENFTKDSSDSSNTEHGVSGVIDTPNSTSLQIVREDDDNDDEEDEDSEQTVEQEDTRNLIVNRDDDDKHEEKKQDHEDTEMDNNDNHEDTTPNELDLELDLDTDVTDQNEDDPMQKGVKQKDVKQKGDTMQNDRDTDDESSGSSSESDNEQTPGNDKEQDVNQSHQNENEPILRSISENAEDNGDVDVDDMMKLHKLKEISPGGDGRFAIVGRDSHGKVITAGEVAFLQNSSAVCIECYIVLHFIF